MIKAESQILLLNEVSGAKTGEEKIFAANELKQIQKKEAEIYNETGITLVAGNEIEFLIRNKNGGLVDDKELKAKIISFYEKSLASSIDWKNNFSKSPIIEDIKEETGNDVFEIIVGDSKKLKEGSERIASVLKKLAPSRVARNTSLVKDLVIKRSQELLGYESVFDAADISHPATAALQSNLSPWANGKNIFSSSNTTDLFEHIANRALELENICYPLFIESERSLARMIISPKTISCDLKRARWQDSFSGRIDYEAGGYVLESARVENRLPGADVRPELAMLIAVESMRLGIKDALGEKVKEGADFDPETMIKTDNGVYKVNKFLGELKSYRTPIKLDELNESLTRLEFHPLAKEMLGGELLAQMVESKRNLFKGRLAAAFAGIK